MPKLEGRIWLRDEMDVVGSWKRDPIGIMVTFGSLPHPLEPLGRDGIKLPDRYTATVVAVQISDPETVLWVISGGVQRSYSGPWRVAGESLVPTRWANALAVNVSLPCAKMGSFRLRMIVDRPAEASP